MNNKTSIYVTDQLSGFIRTDHPQFVKFMEYYYQYLEQYSETLEDGKVLERMSNLIHYYDVDDTHSELKQKLYDQFMRSIPSNVIVDKDLLLKNIQDFYHSNGTEKSVRFLINILTGSSNTEITYPKNSILKVSDGKWYIQKALRVSDIQVNGVSNTNINGFENFRNTLLRGNTSNASAIVERVSRYFETGIEINELALTNIEGEFDNGEVVVSYFTESGETKSITGNVFSGIINSITITDPGAGYEIGDSLVFESNTGCGAIAIVSTVSTGGIEAIGVLNGGAGFQVNNFILITGSGSGANAEITQVDRTELYHPNSYNIWTTSLLSEANTILGNTVYSNLSTLIVSSPNANSVMGDTLHVYTYANTGPISVITVRVEGNNYLSTPDMDAVSNTTIKRLGILGRMSINSPGTGYSVGDEILFVNQPGEYGFKGKANVTQIDGSGGITRVNFVPESGYIAGGYGYRQNALPTVSITSAGGSGANITVTAIIGDGEIFTSSNTSVGSILTVEILNRGSGYQSAPTINLSASGDGSAQATATIVTGVFDYPGRFLNDDGMPSSTMRLQDQDYYQNFSYVVKSDQTFDKYRKTLKEISHPAGLITFAEYKKKFEQNTHQVNTSYEGMILFYPGQYGANDANSLLVYSNSAPANITANMSNVIVEFIGNVSVANLANGYFLLTGNIASIPNNRTYSGNVNIGFIDA